ncbi:MAG TPA: peptidase [Candidatus Angelobacter sp.]|nr:peptidase [Candidatus Angelobacter sp.]
MRKMPLTVASAAFFLLIVGATDIQSLGQQTARYKVGMTQRKFVPREPYNWRGAKTHALVTMIWYPAEAPAQEQPQWIGSPASPFASAGKAASDAKLAASPAKFPLIVLSHGTGASAPMMAWLGTALAAHGYIAAAVNHPGNNALESYTPQGFGLWWERAHDLSTLIDQMLADPMFASRIDSKRIGAAGFSLGGYTMIEIAGGITQPSLLTDFCKSKAADGMCVPPAEFPDLNTKLEAVVKSDHEVQTSFQHASDSYRDARVRAVFAIAPALGPAFKPESLAKISIPVEIVAGDADTVVPVASSAKFLALKIPHSKLLLLPGVGHYTFLATCGPQGKQSRADLCTDAAGIDRDQVHDQTAQGAVSFFADHLK